MEKREQRLRFIACQRGKGCSVDLKESRERQRHRDPRRGGDAKRTGKPGKRGEAAGSLGAGPGRPRSPVDVHLPRRAVGLVVRDLGEDAGHDDEGDHPAGDVDGEVGLVLLRVVLVLGPR